MYVPGGYDQAYCYLSVENAPEKRFPVNDGTFFQVLGGWGDVSNWIGNGNNILVPIPADNEITLDSKCLGRQGGAQPNTLGILSASAPKETWDGRRLEIKGPGYTIGYRIQPHGPKESIGLFSYTDYTIPVPSQLKATVRTSSDPAQYMKLARMLTLIWEWTGDRSKLTGFTILQDGKTVQGANQAPAGTGRWEDSIFLPISCGGAYRFQIAANYGAAQSVPSTVTLYEQPSCATYVEVKFEKIRFWCLDDGDVPVIPFIPLDCESGSFPAKDTIESYYWLHANGQEINISADLTTNRDYFFHDLGLNSEQASKYSNYDTFIVPIEMPSNRNEQQTIRFGLHMKDSDPWWDADDHICAIGKDLSMSYNNWIDYEKRFELKCNSRDARGQVTIRIKGFGAP